MKEIIKKEIDSGYDRYKYEDFFYKNKVFEKKNGFIILDLNKFYKSLEDRTLDKKSGGNNFEALYKLLLNIEVVLKEDFENPKKGKVLESRPFFKVPNNIENGVVGNNGEGIIFPWELSRHAGNRWDMKIPLVNGEEMTILELYTAKHLQGLYPLRANDNNLYITDPTDNLRKRFNFRLFREITKNHFFAKSSGEYIPCLKNLFEYGLLRPSELPRASTNSLFSKTHGFQEKKMLSGGKPDILLSRDGINAMYYLGRDKIIGTDTKITETMSVEQMDNTMIAITDSRFGKKEIIYTLKLLPGEKTRVLREKKAAELLGQGRTIPNDILSTYTRVPVEFIKENLLPYDFSSFLPTYILENPTKYLKDIGLLTDAGYVLGQFRDAIQESNISLMDIRWNDQVRIAHGLLTYGNEKFVEKFLNVYKDDGLKVFSSITYGGIEMGDTIIKISEKLPEDVAKKIFSKYAELIDLTENVAEYVQQFQKDHKNQDEVSQESIQDISEKLLVRGKDILVHSMDKTPEEILSMLESVKADAELFKSTFSIEKKRGGSISLENLREAQFETKTSLELSEEEKQAMRELYTKNYASNPPFQKVLLEGFEKSLTNPSTTFYLFKFKNGIKGFDRFDDLGNGQKYFGSFNIDEAMQGATLGDSMIDQSVNVEANHAEIIADCHATNRIGARYIENGFVATNFTENYFGVPAFSIIRNDPETKNIFKTKSMSQEDLELLVNDSRKDIRVFQAVNQEDFLPIFKERVGEGKGYVLTRYFQNQTSKQWSVVLEQVKA